MDEWDHCLKRKAVHDAMANPAKTYKSMAEFWADHQRPDEIIEALLAWCDARSWGMRETVSIRDVKALAHELQGGFARDVIQRERQREREHLDWLGMK